MKTPTLLLALAATAGAQTLVGWNNLGMHCMDDDYSVFSILPPYNTVDCQLIDAAGHLVTDAAGIVVTYQAVADPDGSINTTSVGKTNFWDYSPARRRCSAWRCPPTWGCRSRPATPACACPGRRTRRR